MFRFWHLYPKEEYATFPFQGKPTYEEQRVSLGLTWKTPRILHAEHQCKQRKVVEQGKQRFHASLQNQNNKPHLRQLHFSMYCWIGSRPTLPLQITHSTPKLLEIGRPGEWTRSCQTAVGRYHIPRSRCDCAIHYTAFLVTVGWTRITQDCNFLPRKRFHNDPAVFSILWYMAAETT